MRLKNTSLRTRVALVGLVISVVAAIGAASALALSEGRVYEMVSPAYKAGYSAGLDYVAPSGETVVFGSVGSFAGDPDDDAALNYYVAHRGGSEWSTDAVTPPAALSPRAEVKDFSPTLSMSVTEGRPGPNSGSALYTGQESELRLHDLTLPDEALNFPLAGAVLTPVAPTDNFGTDYVGADASLSHIIVEANEGTFLLNEAVHTNQVPLASSGLYDVVSAGGSESLRLIGLNNEHKEINHNCESFLGAGDGRGSGYNAISADGEEIFFTTGVSDPVTNRECPTHAQLFMRLGGSRTVEVSRPLDTSMQDGGCVGEVGGVAGEVPCKGAVSRAPAEFQGASEDGTRVFFTTSAPLVTGAVSDNLYMATVGCPGGQGEACEPSQREVTGLVQASSGVEPAEVQNIVAVAPDGSHVYFVARGALSAGANAEGTAPVKGADNLYVYDAGGGGATGFIGDLCSGPEESGVVADVRCPPGLTNGTGLKDDTALWQTGSASGREAQVNDCVEPEASCETGRFLLFSSYAQLTADDADTTKDVYRYDAQTGTLERVSVGEAGASENGNGDLFDATIALADERGGVAAQQGLGSRAISQDGSRVVFKSAEPLSSLATPGVVNVYEWHQVPGGSEGRVALVSPGSSAVGQVVISSSGRDVLFETEQGLVPQDTDGLSDVYDARIGGGFPSPPVEAEPCAGDACRGPLTNPAPLLVPGSVVQAPGGNFASPVNVVVKSKSKTKPKLRPKKKVKAKGKGKRARRGVGAASGRGRR